MVLHDYSSSNYSGSDSDYTYDTRSHRSNNNYNGQYGSNNNNNSSKSCCSFRTWLCCLSFLFIIASLPLMFFSALHITQTPKIVITTFDIQKGKADILKPMNSPDNNVFTDFFKKHDIQTYIDSFDQNPYKDTELYKTPHIYVSLDKKYFNESFNDADAFGVPRVEIVNDRGDGANRMISQNDLKQMPGNFYTDNDANNHTLRYNTINSTWFASSILSWYNSIIKELLKKHMGIVAEEISGKTGKTKDKVIEILGKKIDDIDIGSYFYASGTMRDKCTLILLGILMLVLAILMIIVVIVTKCCGCCKRK